MVACWVIGCVGVCGGREGKGCSERCERKVVEDCYAMNVLVTCTRANVYTYFIFSECIDIV